MIYDNTNPPVGAAATPGAGQSGKTNPVGTGTWRDTGAGLETGRHRRGTAGNAVRRRAESRRTGAGVNVGHGLNRQPSARTKTSIRPILFLYLLGTFSAALTAVLFSFVFPSTLHLTSAADSITPPSGIVEVLRGLLMSMVANPIDALLNANYIGILVWAVGLGFALRHGNDSTKNLINDVSHAVTFIVKLVIRFAPLGIFGLVSSTLATTGFDTLWGYAQLLLVLVGCMLLVALVINPLLVFWKIRRNPYPLVLTCLRESGVYAFFTRSSAANIPVNMALCEKLNLDRDTYSVSIPLGATINMAGAAITITVLTLAAVHTLNIPVDLPTALLLSVVASLCACGASGVAGGSLLLIPLACNMFGIPNDVAMQVVAVGFIIGVLQDSCETALNSSTDALFTAAACMAEDEQLAKNALRS